jgi:thiamine biosynthesis lipoprotein
MNTDVLVAGADRPMAPWFRQVEGALSRFDPDSDLSRLNRLSGRWVIVPPLLFRAVRAALCWAAATNGAFDPTVLDALESAGYRHSFEQGQAASAGPRPAGRWRQIALSERSRAVWLPPGVRLDLGGIGKGLAVDGAVARLWGRPRVLVDAGGDLALRTADGDPPAVLDVADPWVSDRTLMTFSLYRGCAATSSVLGRTWGPGLHHIIDPATGLPAQSDLVAATVFADTAMAADVLAKVCIIVGRERALPLLATRGGHGLLVDEAGTVTLTPRLEEYVHVDA